MATRDTSYIPSTSESSGSARELDVSSSFPRMRTSSQVSMGSGSQQSLSSMMLTEDEPMSPLSPSFTGSLSSFSFVTPKVKVRSIRRPKRKRAVKTGRKIARLGKEPVSEPSETPGSMAARKLEFKLAGSPTKHKVKTRSPHDDDVLGEADVLPVRGNAVFDLENLVDVLAQVAVCRSCQMGRLDPYDKGLRPSCVNYLMFRCCKCYTTKCFWSVSGKFPQTSLTIGGAKIPKRNDMVYASVLGGRLIGVGERKLNFYHAALNIPPPPSSFNIIQANILTATEEVARQSMNNAKLQLEGIIGLNPTTNCVHTVASYDGAYQMRSGESGGGFSRYCFASAISVITGKVIAYDVAGNSCRLCVDWENRLRNGDITEQEHHDWKETHDAVCPATFSTLASVHIESAVAPAIVRQALERGVVFTGLVCDGDNKTDETLRKANIYEHLACENVSEIGRMECLSHVVKRMKTNLSKRQQAVLKDARLEKKVALRLVPVGKDRASAERKVVAKFRGSLRTDSKTRTGWQSTSQSEEI